MVPNSYFLPAGYTLTVTVVDGKVHVQPDGLAGKTATNAAPSVFGPYFRDRSFVVQDNGMATVAIAEADVALPSAAQVALLAAIPVADQEDGATIWNDAGVLKISTAA